MSEQVNVPDDLKILFEDATEGREYQDSSQRTNEVLGLIERIAALEAENAELNDNLRQMTECRDDLTRLIAQRDSENAALRQQVESLSAPVTDGVSRIAAERKRQIEVEGWTPEHDGEHRCGELARAACGYAALASYQAGPRNLVDDPLQPPILPRDWPWDVSWWKPSHDLIRNLVKAGALIAAEIDRLAARKGAA
jgi:hypothetical protein